MPLLPDLTTARPRFRSGSTGRALEAETITHDRTRPGRQPRPLLPRVRPAHDGGPGPSDEAEHRGNSAAPARSVLDDPQHPGPQEPAQRLVDLGAHLVGIALGEHRDGGDDLTDL